MALNYLHMRNIAHRDVKLENVLMQTLNPSDLNLKLTDFGFAAEFTETEGFKEWLGTPLYMAPEILKKKVYGKEVDLWAAGVLLFILVYRKPPYSGTNK